MKNYITIIALLFCATFSSYGQELQEVAVPEEEMIYIKVEQMPEFPGGKGALAMFIQENLHYPVVEKANGMEGIIYVEVTITPDGKPYNPRILKGVNGAPGLTEEALRVVGLMPDWEPGMQKGKAVHVQYVIPIAFELDEADRKPKSAKKSSNPHYKENKGSKKPKIDESELIKI
jgi:TonB family protein